MPKAFRGIVLLAGSVRESGLARGVSRSLLDLPIRESATLLQAWCSQAEELACAVGIEKLQLRIISNRSSAAPTSQSVSSRVDLSLEYDKGELRGTGGLLRDIAEDYAPDDVVLVANAYQLLLTPLHELVATLAGVMGDIALLADDESAPCGLQLVRCGVLRSIKSKGFIDFKEQVLPALAKVCQVRVAIRPWCGVLPVRTLDSYIQALRQAHSKAPDRDRDPFAEDWFQTFSIVEESASVHPSAKVHDSVVLGGATVGANAVIVRSVVCEGGVVQPGEGVHDRVITVADRARRNGR
ncbi:MAG: hypothetical protein H7Y88_12200 [Phycisphaerales bacterium]|nr:hypothetical protein [Phycisphaerales bacterium]